MRPGVTAANNFRFVNFTKRKLLDRWWLFHGTERNAIITTCWKAILWNRWKCSSIWVFSCHMISLGVNMFNQSAVRLGRSLAFSTEDSTIMLRVATALLQLYISLIRPHLDYASAIWSPYLSKDKTELENVQKLACRMATRLWDSSYQDLLELVDLPSLECRRLETRLSLLHKIINKLCYFDETTFTISTSYVTMHHTILF